MERATPTRKSHSSTADLLSWSETPTPPFPADSPPNGSRSHQPSDGIRKVLAGGYITDEEDESLHQRKTCSGYKTKEMHGSNIFEHEDGKQESGDDYLTSYNRTSVRIVQQATNGISQISFNSEEKLSPNKPATFTEAAKQRELGGTLTEPDSKVMKHQSHAKGKELSGHDIFGAPREVPPRSLAAVRSMESKESKDMGEPAHRNIRTSVKVSNPAGGQSNIVFGEEPVVKTSKIINDQKFAELTGNDIFKGEIPPGSAEKNLSRAKLREISGSDIFSDGKVESRDYLGGVRQPPGGDSSISLT